MIYTYGHSPSYDEFLKNKKIEGGQALKLGIRPISENFPEGYAGGAIWKTPEEGYAYIKYLFDTNNEEESEKYKIEDWAVYSIDGTWDDVYYIENEPFHRLKTDKIIIEKIILTKM